MSRAQTAYVSAYAIDRIQAVRMFRFRKEPLSADYSAVVGSAQVVSATWYCDNATVIVLGTPTCVGAVVSVPSQAINFGAARIKCEATLSDGSVIPQLFDVSVGNVTAWTGETQPGSGPNQVSARFDGYVARLSLTNYAAVSGGSSGVNIFATATATVLDRNSLPVNVLGICITGDIVLSQWANKKIGTATGPAQQPIMQGSALFTAPFLAGTLTAVQPSGITITGAKATFVDSGLPTAITLSIPMQITANDGTVTNYTAIGYYAP